MIFPRSVTRLEMEAEWRSKLEVVQRRYFAAVAQHNQVLKEALIPTRDAARAAWLGARLEYLHILNIFTRLVVDGEVPPEE